ncbi:MAG: hypothetical protein QOG87_923 [Actinomycetota bacterium]
MRPWRRAVLAAAALALLVGASGCGKEGGGGVDFDAATLNVPADLGGLSVLLEPKATEKLKTSNKSQSYVADGAVFALRRGDELKAVLQVALFTADARPDDDEFRRTIVNQIGGFSGQPTKVAGVPVYATELNEQIFYVWFRDRFFETLSVRKSEAFAPAAERVDVKALLQEAVSLKPEI